MLISGTYDAGMDLRNPEDVTELHRRAAKLAAFKFPPGLGAAK